MPNPQLFENLEQFKAPGDCQGLFRATMPARPLPASYGPPRCLCVDIQSSNQRPFPFAAHIAATDSDVVIVAPADV